MAALTIISATVAAARAGDTAVENKVTLELQITGLGTEGCRIEIKPGHAGCQFKPVEKIVDRNAVREVVKLEPFSVVARSTGADRDCSFEITIKEPGLPAKTVHRGVRLAPPSPDQPAPAQSLRCYLNSPTLVMRDEQARTRR
jgi:hypothetical protein